MELAVSESVTRYPPPECPEGGKYWSQIDQLVRVPEDSRGQRAQRAQAERQRQRGGEAERQQS